MTSRTARCGCGRVEITVLDEPLMVIACYCDFCQKRSGSPMPVQAYFDQLDRVTFRGEMTKFNGREVDDVAATQGHDIDYYFCTACGSTVYWVVHGRLGLTIGIGVGNVEDPDFPKPTSEFNTNMRHRWQPPLPDAEQFEEFGVPT